MADTTIGLSTLVEGFFQESESRRQDEARSPRFESWVRKEWGKEKAKWMMEDGKEQTADGR
ncbi:MAG: hypothetical protein WBD36_02325 [Bacteroidota bacterium]